MSPPLEQILSQYVLESSEIASVDEPQRSLVLFKLAEQKFALYGSQIKEILADRPVSWVPGCPPSLVGVINHRGRVESVISLNRLIGITSAEAASKRTILIGRGDAMQSGILIDKLIDVQDVAESQIQPAAENLSPMMQRIVVGIVTVEQEYYALLDLNLVFDCYQETCGYDQP